MLAELVYVRGEENPDPHAARKEYGVLLFSIGVEDMVMKTRCYPRWEAIKINMNFIPAILYPNRDALKLFQILFRIGRHPAIKTRIFLGNSKRD